MNQGNPYASPAAEPSSNVGFSLIIQTGLSILAGPLVGLLAFAAMVVALRIGPQPAIDVMPGLLSVLLIANLTLGGVLGGIVAWLRWSKNRRVTFGSTLHIVGMAWASTLVGNYLHSVLTPQLFLAGSTRFLAATTIFTYLFASAVIVFWSRPLGQTGEFADSAARESSSGRIPP